MGDEQHGDGHHHHHDHDHPDHHHHHHHHDHDGDPGGPEGSEFLDLEISKVLFGEASELASEVALDLVRDALRERLRERLGERLARVGQLAADELADDIEANLEIEALISARQDKAASLEERLREAFATPESAEQATPTRRAGSRAKGRSGKRPVRG